MRVDKIVITDRYRRDLGDISDLAASIALHGLMHPVVVTNDNRLIAGHRRVEACKSLGWDDVPVRFIESVIDAKALLLMERDENTCRKDMTPSECIALGRALEELERPKAKERMSEGGKGGIERSVPANGPSCERPRPIGDVREIVAPAVGLSTAAYSRAKQLVTAAEQGDLKAAEMVEQMNATGKITPAYEEWRGRKVNVGVGNAPSSRDTFGTGAAAPAEPKKPVNVKKSSSRRTQVQTIENAIATLSGLTSPMRSLTAEDFREATDEARTRWSNELAEVQSTLRRVRDLIKESL